MRIGLRIRSVKALVRLERAVAFVNRILGIRIRNWCVGSERHGKIEKTRDKVIVQSFDLLSFDQKVQFIRSAVVMSDALLELSNVPVEISLTGSEES